MGNKTVSKIELILVLIVFTNPDGLLYAPSICIDIHLGKKKRSNWWVRLFVNVLSVNHPPKDNICFASCAFILIDGKDESFIYSKKKLIIGIDREYKITEYNPFPQ